MHRYLLIAIAVFCSYSATSFAEDLRPEEIPPQRVVELLKAQGVRNVYYLITKDEQYANSQDAGNHYVLVYENGKLRFPRQTSGVVYSDGGSTDLQFENGERLVVPTERASVGYLGVKVTPMMMSADRAPLKLQKVEITDAILNRLGLAKFIAPRADPKTSVSGRQRQNEYVPFVSPETVQIIQFKSTTKLSYEEEDQLKKLINEIDPPHIKTDDRFNYGAFYGNGDTQIFVITEPETSLPKLRAQLKGRGDLSVVSDTYLNEISRSFEVVESNFGGANEETKLSYVEQIYERMGELERYFLMVDRMAQHETAAATRLRGVRDTYVGTVKNAKARRNHTFYKTAIAKIRNVARIGYETLDRIGHPAAQEILTHTAQEFDYVALDIVKRKASVDQQYYFDLWLKFMLSDLDFADKLSENSTELPAEMRIGRAGGGLFRNFKISGELSVINGRGIVPHFMDKRPKFLLNLLGLPGKKDRLKTSLIQYIVDADKKAAKVVAWSDRVETARGERSFELSNFNAKGVTNITDLLVSLAWTQYWARAIDGFSVTEYQASVMDIFTTLFDIASTSLKTTGTMTALIDASIHILNDVENANSDLGVKPNARIEQAAHILENRLRFHLQNSVTSLAHVHSSEAVNACAILLAPNSFAQARKANGW